VIALKDYTYTHTHTYARARDIMKGFQSACTAFMPNWLKSPFFLTRVIACIILLRRRYLYNICIILFVIYIYIYIYKCTYGEWYVYCSAVFPTGITTKKNNINPRFAVDHAVQVFCYIYFFSFLIRIDHCKVQVGTYFYVYVRVCVFGMYTSVICQLLIFFRFTIFLKIK